jgi:hypothetical protein
MRKPANNLECADLSALFESGNKVAALQTLNFFASAFPPFNLHPSAAFILHPRLCGTLRNN